jgi:hypothetical protein
MPILKILKEEAPAGSAPKTILKRMRALVETAQVTWPNRVLVWTLGNEVVLTLLHWKPRGKTPLSTDNSVDPYFGYGVQQVSGRLLAISPVE